MLKPFEKRIPSVEPPRIQDTSYPEMTLDTCAMTTIPGTEANRPKGGRTGGSAGDAKRKERAARKLEQEATEAASGIDDDSSMMTLKYTFQEPVGEIRITEDWSGDGNAIAGLQWPGGVVLSRYMDCRQVFPEDHFVERRVIEVGAGCGLTSIYTVLRGANATITDMDTAKCVANVDMNLGEKGLAGKASVMRLQWDCAAELALLEPPYDVVIAGDCLYEEACISPLLKTMWALSGPDTEILLCGVVGHGILASFLRKVDQYFERETVDTSKIDTLAEVLPLGTLSDAAAIATALARASAAAELADPAPNLATDSLEDDEAKSGGDKKLEEGASLGGSVGATGVEAGAAVVLAAATAGGGLAAGKVLQLPGQRALLRLRKKCDAVGVGE